MTLPEWLTGRETRRTWLGVVLIASLLVIPAAAWAAGGTRTGMALLLFAPVIVAGASFGRRAGAWTGLAAGVLSWLVPFSTDLGTSQAFPRAALRLGVLIISGWFVGYVRSGLLELARSRSRFLSTVSHELRTPLTSMLGFSEVLYERRDELPDPSLVEMVETLRSESFKMSHTLDQMLVAARLDTGAIAIDSQPVDLRAALDELIGHLPPIGSSIDIVLEGKAVALCDPLRTRQLLRNLIVHVAQSAAARAEVSLSSNGQAMVELTYEGSQLIEDPRMRVFAPLFDRGSQPDLPIERWLPLSVSRQLAVLMGGDLSHRSDGGRAVFRLLLPAAAT